MRRWLLRIALTLLILALGAGLWVWSDDPARESGTLRGGRLFTFSADAVAALEIRRLEGVSRIAQGPDGQWALTGLVTDLVDAERFEAILATLVAGQGFAVLAGTEPDARRYGFGGENALELVFELREGGRHRLALGDVNPVTEVVYASGAGRPNVFAVGGGYYATAVRLPDSARLAQLLPGVRADDLDSLRIDRRGGPPLLCSRLEDDRWWLRLPAGLSDLVGRADRYHSFYDDRRREHAGRVWVQADVRRLRDVVYRATETAVAVFPGPQFETPAALADLGLLPLYRGLTLYPAGGDSLRLELGEEQVEGERRLVPARRQGALVITRAEALIPLEGALQEFLDLGALSFKPAVADSYRIDEPDRPLLWGRRAAVAPARRPATKVAWDPVEPQGWRFAFGAESTANHLSDMQITLDRLEALEILPPAAEDPLRAQERWRLRAWLPAGRFHEVWLGRLEDDGRAAVWEPADGKCVVIPEQMLITLRNLRLGLERE